MVICAVDSQGRDSRVGCSRLLAGLFKALGRRIKDGEKLGKVITPSSAMVWTRKQLKNS